MIEPRDTDVLVLAGGLGTRLKSVVADRPKPLAEIHGRPFLYYLLAQVAAAGYSRITLCVGHRAAQVEEQLPAYPEGLDVRFSREDRPLGTAGALGLAAPLLRSDQVLVLNGDSFIDSDLAAFSTWHAGSGFEIGLIATHVEDAGRYGTLEIEASGRIQAFREKRGISEPGWINAGAYIFPRSRLAAIPSDRAASLETDLFPGWVEAGIMGAWRVRDRFIDIGTPESYSAATRFFSPGTLG